MQEALQEEVRLTNVENKINHDEWLNTTINKRTQTKLTVCFDTGWQK